MEKVLVNEKIPINFVGKSSVEVLPFYSGKWEKKAENEHLEINDKIYE